MGRKVDMKKIENITKCQVTFSKRRSSLFKKAHEISVLCDVDVALVAFSPSGRLGKFCSRKRSARQPPTLEIELSLIDLISYVNSLFFFSFHRIEDVLERYIDLSPDKRYQYDKIYPNLFNYYCWYSVIVVVNLPLVLRLFGMKLGRWIYIILPSMIKQSHKEPRGTFYIFIL